MTNQVDCIVCVEPGRFDRRPNPLVPIQADDVLVRIRRVGICGTDLHAYAGNQPFFSYPRILGHELAGEVVEIGATVDNVSIGDRVVVMPYITCGQCIACKRGRTNCCTSMQVLGVHIDGGMQEKFVLSSRLLKAANDLEFEEIAVVEPLAIGAHAIRRANIESGDTLVIVGAGPIGLGIVSFAMLAGATVILVDRIRSRLEFARDKLGVEHVINATERDAVQSIGGLTGGDLADIVIDATGSRGALEAGPNLLAHGGKYILVGLYNGNLSFHHPTLHAKEASILCSRNATREDFSQVLHVLRKRQFPVSDYISHRVDFDNMIDQYDN